MDKEKVIELLPILQAFADGKAIQVRSAGTPHKWVDAYQVYLGDNYRIKPVPIEIWALVDPNDNDITGVDSDDDSVAYAYATKDSAEAMAENNKLFTKVVKFMQVIDDL